MSDTASEDVWQVEAEGADADILAAAETLGFLEDMEALSLSVFETVTGLRLEAGYATQSEARSAADRLSMPTSVRHVPARDWVSEVQSQLAPVSAGRFTLHGSHDRDSELEGVLIEVEAGPAFGSGHHPTTRGCLEVFSDRLDDGIAPTRVLDLGCGTGVLAIAAALTTDAEVVASDIDPDAVEVTEATSALNEASLTTFVAEGMDDPRLSGPFDLIFANILAGPLRELAPDIEKATAKGGLVILSGLLVEQTDSVLSAYTDAGLELLRRHAVEGWTTLLLGKP